MMGAHHAVTGAAAWCAVSCTVPGALGLTPTGPDGVLIGAITCAGAALLPDADHPHATIARSVPLFGRAGANAVNGLSGGHRHGTHSLVSVPIVFLLASLLQHAAAEVPWWHQTVWWGPGLATAALVAFASKSMRMLRSWPNAWTLGAVCGGLVAFLAPAWPGWVPLSITLGFVVHLAGDFLTVGGLPLLWPFNPKPPRLLRRSRLASRLWRRNGYFALPLLGKTGSPREWALATIVSVYTVYLVVAQLMTGGAAAA
ncbi:MAG: metal-dependent hydrolase [Pseudoclavibacter sp.]|nr:metal-dependent hydrolase [Pseudoclavibacter sp.]